PPAPCASPLSLHDALPILAAHAALGVQGRIFEVSLLGATRTIALFEEGRVAEARALAEAGFERALDDQDDVGRSQYAMALGFMEDRKSTRLNSSHVKISYA